MSTDQASIAWTLFVHFAMLSLMAVGGGVLVLAPDMQRFVVDANPWMSNENFIAAYTIAQVAPGPNVLFVALVGMQAAGLIGAAAATLALIVPPAAIVPVRVLFDNESSERTTILEVFAHDSVGLLYAITKELHDARVSVRAAKIGTYLDQVVDAFHLTDLDGGKIVDSERLESLRRAIEKVAAPVTSPSSGG